MMIIITLILIPIKIINILISIQKHHRLCHRRCHTTMMASLERRKDGIFGICRIFQYKNMKGKDGFERLDLRMAAI